MSSLAEYIKSRKLEQDELSSRTAQTRQEWLGRLDDLVKTIRGWLEDAEQAGLEAKESTIEISEERLGTYQAPMLALSFGGRSVAVRPRARYVVGGDGRVDVDGDFGIDMLVFSKATDAWHIVYDRSRPEEGRPLTRESFEQTLKAHL